MYSLYLGYTGITFNICKIHSQAMPMFYSLTKDSPIGVRLQMIYARGESKSFLMKGSKKLLAVQPGSV